MLTKLRAYVASRFPMTIGDAMMKLLNRTDDSPVARFYSIEWSFKTPHWHWDLLSLFATLCLATMLLEVVVFELFHR